jgi:hypothetical protein
VSKMQDAALAYLTAKWDRWGWDDDEWETYVRRPMEFNFVASNLIVGSAIADMAGVERLKELGVTDVICCAQEWDAIDAKLLASSGINFLAAGTTDDMKPKPASWFLAGIDFARKANGGRLYVHCNMGINRAPSMTYAILRSRGLSQAEAETSMLARPRKGFGATNPYFANYENGRAAKAARP